MSANGRRLRATLGFAGLLWILYGIIGGPSVWSRSNLLVIVPLAAFGAIIFGFGLYNTICKNTGLWMLDC